MTLPAGPDPCPTPQNNCSLCRPVCQVKNAQSTKSLAYPQNRLAVARRRKGEATHGLGVRLSAVPVVPGIPTAVSEHACWLSVSALNRCWFLSEGSS